MSLNKQKGNMYNWKLPDIEMLKILYWDKKLSTSIIAEMFNVTKGAVRNKFHRYDVARRTLSDSQSLISNHINLSFFSMNFIDGLLLGDGSISLSLQGLSATYKHTDKNKEYILWLAEMFADMGIEVIYKKDYAKISQLSTKYYRDFVAIRKRWYPTGIKQVPFDIQIKPITLLNWYIGDGNYHKGRNGTLKSESVTIAMQYDQKGKLSLCQELMCLGIENTPHEDRIYIKSNGRQQFFNYMMATQLQIPKCYQYKFPERYCHGSK